MAKKFCRLAPCPAYDIPGWESWLEDMGREGLVPVTFDNHQPFIILQQAEPTEYRYRLEPIPGRSREPSEDLLSLAEALGWEYTGRRGSFFVFRTADPHVPELHTEPETQALALNHLKKLFRNGLLVMAAELLILGVLLVPQFGLTLGEYGSVYILALFFGILTLLASQSIGLIRIRKFQKTLCGGHPMAHRRDWRNGANAAGVGSLVSWLLALVLLCCWAEHGMRSLGLGEMPLAEYPGQPPFVTLETLSQEPVLNRISNGTCRKWWDPLFPVCVSWLDGGQVTYPDGTWTAGLLEVQYCEALTPWLAEAVAKGYRKAHGAAGVVHLADLELDYAASFTDRHGLPRAVLVDGNTVVCIRMSMEDPKGSFTLENWVSQMAKRLEEEV